MTKFFTFYQNDSGGYFEINDNLAEYVIIEAHSYKEANEKAEKIGIYFDGVDIGIDCECCGDRWTRQWDDDDGTDEPTIFGTPVNDYQGDFSEQYRIHYLNNVIERGYTKSKYTSGWWGNYDI